MNVLAFDTGTTTGWCLFSVDEKRPIKWGKFTLEVDEKKVMKERILGTRLHQFEVQLISLMKDLIVHEGGFYFVGAEILSMQRNMKVTIYLSSLLGILSKVTEENIKIPVSFYYVTEAKKALTGKGNLEKIQVLQFLNHKYDMKLVEPEFTKTGNLRAGTGDLDIADATAIAHILFLDVQRARRLLE